jgi:hypothetical protein
MPSFYVGNRDTTLRYMSAMAAGVTTKLWELVDMVKVLEQWEAHAPQARITCHIEGAISRGDTVGWPSYRASRGRGVPAWYRRQVYPPAPSRVV